MLRRSVAVHTDILHLSDRHQSVVVVVVAVVVVVVVVDLTYIERGVERMTERGNHLFACGCSPDTPHLPSTPPVTLSLLFLFPTSSPHISFRSYFTPPCPHPPVASSPYHLKHFTNNDNNNISKLFCLLKGKFSSLSLSFFFYLSLSFSLSLSLSL